MIKCCKPDCPDRSPTCHATCGRYKKEKKAHEEQLMNINKQRRTNDDAYCTLKDGANRAVYQNRGHKKLF